MFVVYCSLAQLLLGIATYIPTTGFAQQIVYYSTTGFAQQIVYCMSVGFSPRRAKTRQTKRNVLFQEHYANRDVKYS